MTVSKWPVEWKRSGRIIRATETIMKRKLGSAMAIYKIQSSLIAFTNSKVNKIVQAKLQPTTVPYVYWRQGGEIEAFRLRPRPRILEDRLWLEDITGLLSIPRWAKWFTQYFSQLGVNFLRASNRRRVRTCLSGLYSSKSTTAGYSIMNRS